MTTAKQIRELLKQLNLLEKRVSTLEAQETGHDCAKKGHRYKVIDTNFYYSFRTFISECQICGELNKETF